ncbi:MAG: WD40 repeat domain-containing protein, partial [Planctomycetota bacterium]
IKPFGALAFLPGKAGLVAACDDGSLRYLDLSFGFSPDVSRGHLGPVRAIATTRDGGRFLTGGADNAVLFRERGGKEVVKLPGHDEGVNAVALSEDGRRGLSASDDRTLRVWDLEKGTEVGRFDGHAGPVLACALSPDGKRALSGGADFTVRLWDVAQQKPLSSLAGHCGPVTGIAFLPDEKRTVTTSADGTVILWDVASGKRLQTLLMRIPRPQTSIAVLTKTLRPITGSSGGPCVAWDYEINSEWFSFGNPGPPVTAIAALKDQDAFIFTSPEGTFRKYDLDKRVSHFKAGHAEGLALAASRDGKSALSGGSEGRLMHWSVAGMPAEIAEVGSLATSITAVAFGGDGVRAITGGGDGTISLWDVKTKERAAIAGHVGPVLAVAFARSERWAISTGADRTLRLWDLEKKQLVETIEYGADAPLSLAVLSDGRSFLVGTKRALVLRYELDAGK